MVRKLLQLKALNRIIVQPRYYAALSKYTTECGTVKLQYPMQNVFHDSDRLGFSSVAKSEILFCHSNDYYGAE